MLNFLWKIHRGCPILLADVQWEDTFLLLAYKSGNANNVLNSLGLKSVTERANNVTVNFVTYFFGMNL